MSHDEHLSELKDEIARLRTRLEAIEAKPASRPALARRRRSARIGLVVAACLLVPLVAWAVNVPFTFVNGEVADATEVNANFDSLAAELTNHIEDPNAHHVAITSVDGLAGGTITGAVTVTDSVNVPTIQSPTTLSITSGASLDLGSVVVTVDGTSRLDLNGGLIELN